MNEMTALLSGAEISNARCSRYAVKNRTLWILTPVSAANGVKWADTAPLMSNNGHQRALGVRETSLAQGNTLPQASYATQVELACYRVVVAKEDLAVSLSSGNAVSDCDSGNGCLYLGEIRCPAYACVIEYNRTAIRAT